MNDNIVNLGLAAGLLNYIDNETPPHYFVDAHADIKDVEQFAQTIVFECVKIAVFKGDTETAKAIIEHFGVK